MFTSKQRLVVLAVMLSATARLQAHPLSFNSTVTYSSSRPSGGTASITNWSGASFDAGNIGGSGVNADGGANNGMTNDSTTYVANNQPVQGQTFTTGSHSNGYDVTSITVRMAGYTNNVATGSNQTAWNLNFVNGPIIVSIGKISGTSYATRSCQNFLAGGTGNPGAGSSSNGTGTYLTFNLPFTVHLESNTTYGFDLIIGNGGGNYFEWHGLGGTNAYAGGTAYTRSGSVITPLNGQRVFMVNLTASATPYAPFTHPGTLHTQVDLDRMAAKVAASLQPWKQDYDILATSPYAQTGWSPAAVPWIIRGGTLPNNYTRSQQDAQAIYELALRWLITGDTAYADRAVIIANAWASTLVGVTGDSNLSLAAGLCGYLFAIGGELLSTYPDWAEADKQAYKDMMMRVFYPANFDFLWRHHDTPVTKGGNTHYRLNWDTDNMASLAAIGILCDNKAVYDQAVDYFKYGAGNGRVERAAWYIHPDGTAQTEESGRDQGHDLGGWYSMALLCQMAWNQGEDLFAYDNNRVLRAFEYIAKYNVGYDVPWVYHRNTDLAYTETLSSAGRGLGGYYQSELVYNHYANVKGIAAPYSKLAVAGTRPEPRPHTEYHPSQVDWLGLGSLTFAQDDTVTNVAPSGLAGNWSKNQVGLYWWGSATATGYQIQRAPALAGPYTVIGTTDTLNLNFVDTNVVNGTNYYYKISAITSAGTLDSAPLLVNQALVTRYTFDGNASDSVGTRHAAAKGGAAAPGYAAGQSGQAISLNGADQYVQLPAGSGNYRDITLSAWVYWNGGAAWQRVFDFGSEIEKFMMLTVNAGSNLLRFHITTSRGTDGSLTLIGPAMPSNTWTHVAVTLNGDTATMYVNGVPVASGASTGQITPLFGQPYCYLGKSLWNPDPLFSGRLDDFRIYNYALTGKAVYSLWGQGGTNSAPMFTSNPITKPNATQDASYTGQTLAGSATDVNGGTLIYSKVSGPAWLTVATNGTLSGTPGNSDVGAGLYVVRVTDPSGATDDANLCITVNNVNDAPTWSTNSLARPAVTRGQPYLSYTLAGAASDVDAPYGDSVSYSKVSGPAWLGVAADGTLSGTPGAGDVGTNTFAVRVTDNAGAYNDATLTINVLSYMLCSQYRFEGEATDSISALHGTASGSPVYGTGRIGQGMVLDGSDDYVSLPSAAIDYQDFTVAAWVLWNGGAAWQRIFDFGNDTTHFLFLTPNSGSGMLFDIKNGDSEQKLSYATPLPSGTWMHVVVTVTGSTAMLYLNGVSVATNGAGTVHPGDFKPANLCIGKSQFADPLFSGMIDDFRIYNYAITPADIAALVTIAPATPLNVIVTPRATGVDLSWGASQGAVAYTVKRSTTSGGPYTVLVSGLTGASYSDTSGVFGVTYYYVISATNAQGESSNSDEVSGMVSDLLLHLKFNETNGTVAADSSGSGYDATLSGSPTFSAGYLQNALNLASVSSQYASLPAGIVSRLGDFTISAWIKIASFSTWARVFDFGTGTTDYMFLAPQYTAAAPNNAKPRFAIRTPSVGEKQLNSSVAITTGTWNHVAITLGGNLATLYVNGIVAATNAAMTLNPASLGTTTQNYLGKSQFADPYFNGSLDDVRIYSRALSAAEIGALSAQSAIPVAPQNLAATAGARQIALSWSAVASATRYNVKRAFASGGPYSSIAADVISASYTDTGLVDGVTYYYVVSAQNGTNESANSAEANARSGVVTVDWFAELFSSSTTDKNDTAYTTFTFTPANNTNSYVATRAVATTFPTDPAGGTRLTLGDDAYSTVTLSSTNKALLYGVAYSNLYVGSNGYITFGSGDTAYTESVSNHFSQARISALFYDLDPSRGTPTNSWKQLSDRVAVTWQNVRSYNSTKGNNFQVECFFDGRIRITILGLNVTRGLIGLSRGGGTPTGFSESNFSAYPALTAPVGLTAVGGSQSVALSWNAASGAAGYWVKRSASSGSGYTTIGLASGASYADTAVVDGVTYYYVVSAVSMAGESANTAEASATTYTTLERWRYAYFGTTEAIGSAADTTDPDGDGANNAQEFLAGTNPNDASSIFRINFMSSSSSGTLMGINSVLGRNYGLERSTSLLDNAWTTVRDNITGTGGLLQVTDTNKVIPPVRYYRLIVR